MWIFSFFRLKKAFMNYRKGGSLRYHLIFLYAIDVRQKCAIRLTGAIDIHLSAALHVSVITGSEVFRPLAEKYSMPFAVAGFEGEEILTAIYGLVKSIGRGEVMNYYPQVVTAEGNQVAKEKLARYFRPYDAVWRGMGAIPGSGIILKDEYAGFDAGSAGLSADNKYNSECMCGTILTGRAEPEDCPLFAGKVCTPQTPQGACMVSFEGSCYQSYITGVVR